MTLLGVAFQMLALRHSNRPQIQGTTPQLFHAYLGHLLGEFVYQMVAKDSGGRTLACPPWNQVLLYEYQIRRKAYSLMANTNKNFTECLKEAWQDPVIKERYFNTPLAWTSSSTSKVTAGRSKSTRLNSSH